MGMNFDYDSNLIKIYKNMKLPIQHTKKPIFHYTSPEGILGILNSKSLFATDLNYLNDKSEGIYGLSLLQKELNSLLNGKDLLEPYILHEIKEAREDIKNNYLFHTYTISFSMNSDLLGMWNYYTKGNSIRGYNIGFNVGKLLKNIHIIVFNENDEKVDLVSKEYLHPVHGKVIYSYNRQIDILKNIIDELTQFYDEFIENDYKMQTLAYFIVRKVLFVSVFFKDECFRQEQEYRIAFNATMIAGKEFQQKGVPYKELFRVSNGNIVPYQKCEFAPEAVSSITCSPTLQLQEDRHVQNKINQSKIPVRF